MQFFLIFLILIFTVCVQILKPGLKKWKQQHEEKFHSHSKIFAKAAKCWCSGNFTSIAKFRYVAKLMYGCPPYKSKQCTVTKVNIKKKQKKIVSHKNIKKKYCF